jgi:hypothetical protein
VFTPEHLERIRHQQRRQALLRLLERGWVVV